MKMKMGPQARTYLIAALLAAAAIVIAYFGFGGGGSAAPAGPTTAHPRPPVMVSGNVPASSYGAGAVGAKNATSISLAAPVSSATLGTLLGTAKVIPGGAKPDFTSIILALYDPKTGKLLAKTPLAADGSYQFIVEPGEYVLNIVKGTGSSAQLPQRLYLAAGQVQNVNFFVR